MNLKLILCRPLNIQRIEPNLYDYVKKKKKKKKITVGLFFQTWYDDRDH